MDAPSLEVFKARLDGALSNLVQWEVSLPVAGGHNWMGFKVSSNPNHSVSPIPTSKVVRVRKSALTVPSCSQVSTPTRSHLTGYSDHNGIEKSVRKYIVYSICLLMF